MLKQILGGQGVQAEIQFRRRGGGGCQMYVCLYVVKEFDSVERFKISSTPTPCTLLNVIALSKIRPWCRVHSQLVTCVYLLQ